MSKEGALRRERERTAQRKADPGYDPLTMARAAVQTYWNGGLEKYGGEYVTLGELYPVIFAYILGGWKALISSDAWDDTSYFEVTYNQRSGELVK